MNDETVLKRLFDISTQSQIGFDRQIQAMLQLGVERLGVEMGLLALLRADALELAYLRGPSDCGLATGLRLALDEVGGPAGLPTELAEGAADPAGANPVCRLMQERWGFEASIGVAVKAEREVRGMLVFANRRVRTAPLPAADLEILGLMAGWTGNEMWRRDQEEHLRRAEERFRKGVEAAPAGMLIVDDRGIITYANAQAQELFGYEGPELEGQSIELLVPERVRAAHEQARRAFVGEQANRTMGRGRDLEAVRRDGTVIPVEIGLTSVETSDGLRIMCTVVDLTQRRRYEEVILNQTERLQRINAALAEQAISDPLTGLVNRRGLQAQMELALRLARRHRLPTSLLMLDVDHFKEYNDTYGHPAGDEALKAVAAVLQATARGSDAAARYGGEEFVVLLPETDWAGAQDLAERLRRRVEGMKSLRRPVTVSIGVATLGGLGDDGGVTPQAGVLADRLIREADAALYEAKQRGRNRVVGFGVG